MAKSYSMFRDKTEQVESSRLQELPKALGFVATPRLVMLERHLTGLANEERTKQRGVAEIEAERVEVLADIKTERQQIEQGDADRPEESRVIGGIIRDGLMQWHDDSPIAYYTLVHAMDRIQRNPIGLDAAQLDCLTQAIAATDPHAQTSSL